MPELQADDAAIDGSSGGGEAISGRAVRRSPTIERLLRWVTSGWALFVVVLVVYMGSGVDLTQNDPSFTPLTAYSLIHERDLDLDEFSSDLLVDHPLVIVDDSGRKMVVPTSPEEVESLRSAASTHTYDFFPWTTAIVGIPSVIAADASALVLGGPDAAERLETRTFGTFHRLAAAAVVALSAVVFLLLSRLVFGGSALRRRVLAVGAASVFAFGTSAWSTASRALWQHGPSLLCITMALYLAVRIDTRPATSGRFRSPAACSVALGMALAAAVVSRPTNIWLAAALLGWLLVRHRQLFIGALAGAAGVGVCFLAANWLLAGSPVPLYYAASRLQVHSRFAEALAAQWVSPSRGLLWMSPVVLFAIPGVAISWRRSERRGLVVALVVSVVGVTLAVSAFPHWWAGHSFGPRFMTEVVPQLLLLALPFADAILPATLRGPWRHPVAVLIACVLVSASVLIHGVGATTPIVWCWNVQPVNIDQDPERVWEISGSQPALAAEVVVDRSWGDGC